MTKQRRAKIVATIGPASSRPDRLRALVDAGLDVARLNFSHGRHEDHARVIRSIREISKEKGRAIGILLDLQGPKIRTGEIAGGGPIHLEPGARLQLTPERIEGTPDRVQVVYENLARDLEPGDTILIDDGKLELRVCSAGRLEVEVEAPTGGELGAHKGVNFPGVQLTVDALTPKDKADLRFGLEHKVDLIAMSFVRRGQDMKILRELMRSHISNADDIPIIAKLERPEAVDNLEDILDHSDGVMVARGDLGIEVAAEKVPSIQKRIILRANMRQRMVITATQMLESMIHNARPTRAEASDVANAVFDGSDALMLSGETAAGEHPVRAVRTMSDIIRDAEAHMAEWGWPLPGEGFDSRLDAVATTRAAFDLAKNRAAAVAVFTRSGRTAIYMSKTRTSVPILGFTPDLETYNQLALCWGVEAYLVPRATTVEEMIRDVRQVMEATGRLQPGQKVVIVASLPIGKMGPANFSLLQDI